jgi:hypothetical protein
MGAGRAGKKKLNKKLDFHAPDYYIDKVDKIQCSGGRLCRVGVAAGLIDRDC